MKYDRKFIIKLIDNNKEYGYVKDIFKSSIGFFYEITFKIENAKIWKYRKNCQSSIKSLENHLDPTKKKLKKYKYDIIDITDNRVLRSIKLNKINKK
jgi:hypothetical protein